MMDWKFVLVLVLGLTYCQKSIGQAYTPGQEYLYEYEAQLATGMPEGSRLYSGLKITCYVRFQFKTVSRVTMMMDTIKLYKLIDIVPDEDPTREQLSSYEELTGQEASWMVEHLSKSITFKYIRGHVSEIQADQDEDVWSMNVKRGVLSMMEMNFEERRSVDSKDRSVQINRNSYSPYEFYKVMEASVVGDCETLYQLRVDKEYMHVTKVRNYKMCIDRPVYTRSMFNGMHCAECEKDMTEPFMSGSQVFYVVKGDKTRFLIYSAMAESQHIFTPYSKDGGSVATYINQTFTLIQNDDIKKTVPGPRNPEIRNTGLIADVEYTSRVWKPLTAAKLIPEAPKRTPDESKQLIMKYVDMVYTYTKDYVDEMATSMTFTLIDHLRYVDSDVMRAVWQEYNVKDEPAVQHDDYSKYFKRKVLLDLLPMIGTPASVEFLTEYIRNSNLKPDEAAMSLNMLTVTAYPDINVAKHLLELVRDNYVKSTEPIRRSAYLCLGAITDRIWHEEENMMKELQHKERLIKLLEKGEPRKQVRDKLDSRHVDIQDKMEKTSTIFSKLKMEIMTEVRTLFTSHETEDIVMALKTIGNIGFPDFITDIKSILDDGSQPMIMRTHAIYSLRKMADYSPEAVRTLLWPYYFNFQEPEDVRIAAYLIISFTNPPRHVLESIAHSLYTEENPHVGTFVYTHLEQLANSTHPCLMSWAKNATFALWFAKMRFSPSFHYSQFMHFSSYYDDMKMGAALDFGYTSSPDEFFPRSFAVNGNMHILGYSTNVFQVGMHTEGLQTLARKILGPGSKLSRGKSIMDIFKFKGREESTDTSEESQEKSSVENRKDPTVKNIHDRLKVEERTSTEPRGHMYFKLFNNEVRYFDFDESILKKVLKTGMVGMAVNENELKEGKEINFYRSAMFLQEHHSWFTELGLPILFKLKGSTTYKVSGSWKFEHSTSVAGRVYQAMFDIYPSMAMELRGIVEADFYYFKSGAGVVSKIQSGSPLSFSFNADTGSGKYIAKMNFKNLKENFMHSDIRPTFYVERQYMDASKEHTMDFKYIDSMQGASLTPISWEYGKQEFGWTFSMKGQIAQTNFLRRLPYYPFYGRNTMCFTVEPGNNPPEAGEFQFYYTPTTSSTEKDKKTNTPDSMSQTRNEESRETTNEGMLAGLVSYIWGKDKESDSRSEPSKSVDTERMPKSEEERTKQESKDYQTDILKSKTEHGFVFRIIGVGSNPERKFDFEGQYRNEHEERKCYYSFKFTRTPFTDTETSQYEITMKGTWMYPEMEIEPSDLLDPSYQRTIQKLIRRFIKRDGEQDDAKQILDIQRHYSGMEALWRMWSPAQSRWYLNYLVDELLEENKSSTDQTTRDLIHLVKRQKTMSKHMKRFVKQRLNIIDAQIKFVTVKDLLDQLLDINDKLVKTVDSPTPDTRSVLKKVVILRQQDNFPRLENIVKVLVAYVDSQRKQDLRDRISQYRNGLMTILQKQYTLDQDNSRPEEQWREEVDLRREQSKVLREVCDSSTTKLEIRPLLTMTESFLQKLDRFTSDTETPYDRFFQMLDTMVQHHQVVKALRRSRKFEDRKDVMSRLEDLNRAVVMMAQIRYDTKEIKTMEKTRSPKEVTLMKAINKLRLKQSIIAVSIPRMAAIDKDYCENIIRKIEEISEKVARRAEEVTHYSSIVHRINFICETQIQLLDKIQTLSSPKEKTRGERIMKDKVMNVEIMNSLMKRVEGSYRSLRDTLQSPDTLNSREDSTGTRPTDEERLQSDNNMCLLMDITFGYEGLQSKTVHIEMTNEKSMSQLMWEATQTSPMKDELVQRYLDETEYPDSRSRDAYRDLKWELNIFRHFHFKVQYNKDEFESYWRMMFWRFQEFVKYTWFKHLELHMPVEMSDIWEIVFDIRRNDQQFDLMVSTPLEMDKFWEINFPSRMLSAICYSIDMLKSPSGIPVRTHLSPVSMKLPGECEFRERSIRTLDQHVMEIPDTRSCDIVLAMDCSSSAKFVVKSRKITEDPLKRAIYIAIETRNVEVVKGDKYEVRVDGQLKELNIGRPLFVYSESDSRERRVLAEVTKQGRHVHILLSGEGIRIAILDDHVRVQVSPYQYSKVCGLCGNYDGISRNDMENPRRLRQNSPSCLAADYVLSNDQCDAQSIKDQCRKEQPIPPETCEPLQRTRVTSRDRNGKRQMCFSVDPVRECKPGCYEVRPTGRLVWMKCLDHDSTQTEVFLSQSSLRPLHEIRSISVRKDDELKTYVKVPYSCSRD